MSEPILVREGEIVKFPDPSPVPIESTEPLVYKDPLSPDVEGKDYLNWLLNHDDDEAH